MKTATDAEFLARRRRRLKLWPVIGAVLVLGLLAISLWLWFSVPYLVNPWFVIDSIKSEQLDKSSLLLMAVMLPMVVMCLITVVGVLLLFAFTAFSNERRLLKIIENAPADAQATQNREQRTTPD